MTIVRILECQGKAIDFITYLVNRELAATTERNVLFRINSVATKGAPAAPPHRSCAAPLAVADHPSACRVRDLHSPWQSSSSTSSWCAYRTCRTPSVPSSRCGFALRPPFRRPHKAMMLTLRDRIGEHPTLTPTPPRPPTGPHGGPLPDGRHFAGRNLGFVGAH